MWNPTATRRSWGMMKNRCNNPNGKEYSRYGGRGITYQESWEQFANFLSDMGERPEGTTLDRIDNDGSYNKENCRWATRLQQNLNKGVYKRTKSTLSGTRRRDNGKWIAQIMILSKKIHLGTFDTEEEAHEAFITEREKRNAATGNSVPEGSTKKAGSDSKSILLREGECFIARNSRLNRMLQRKVLRMGAEEIGTGSTEVNRPYSSPTL